MESLNYKMPSFESLFYSLKEVERVHIMSFLKKEGLFDKYLSYKFRDNNEKDYYNNTFHFNFNKTKEGEDFWTKTERKYTRYRLFGDKYYDDLDFKWEVIIPQSVFYNTQNEYSLTTAN